MKESKKRKAALTVEAALIMPIVLSVLLFFLYFLQILYVEQNLYAAAIKALRDTSACGYIIKYADSMQNALEDLEEGEGKYFDVPDIAKKVLRSAGSHIWFQSVTKNNVSDLESIENAVKGGFAGISFQGSDAYADDELTVVNMQYRILFPVFQTLIPPISFQKQFVMRSFSGDGILIHTGGEKDEDAENPSGEEQYVYVTETGTVYHINSNCTYIKRKVEQQNIEELEILRNKYGGKYYPCSSCAGKGTSGSTVWVTKSGTHYHFNKDCSKIKRDIKKLPISEADKYRPCSRCAAERSLND